MKTVILPTDFSKNSKNAINWIVQFLKNEKINFILLNAYFSPQAGAVSVVSINEMIKKQALEDLKDYKTELETAYNNSNHKFLYDAIYGDVTYAINTTKELYKDVSVVVGAKGMSAMEKLFIGSNTSTIIKNVDVPVFVIPEKVKYKEIHKIGLAVDFQKSKNPTAFQFLNYIIKTTKAQLSIFHIETDAKASEEGKERTTKTLKTELGLKELSITSINNEEPLVGVQKFIHSHSINLLVLVNRKKSFFAELFHNSFSKQMAFYADVPLLILHN